MILIEDETDNMDVIEDFDFLSGDRIGISVQISSLSFIQEGSNIVIQLEAEAEEEDNIILATVSNSIGEEVRSASFFFDLTTVSVPDVLPFGDAALRIGA